MHSCVTETKHAATHAWVYTALLLQIVASFCMILECYGIFLRLNYILSMIYVMNNFH